MPKGNQTTKINRNALSQIQFEWALLSWATWFWVCLSRTTQTCFLHLTLLQCVMMLLWWCSYALPLLFWCPLSGSCNEVVWQQNLSGIFLIHHWRPAWLSSYRKYIKHELKMTESNLHWLGQKMWMLLILYLTTQKYSLFVSNSRTWHPKRR